MAKLFDKDGNEIEAFTPEEVETQKQEVVKLEQEKLTTLQKELDSLKDKDINFGNLKEQVKKKEEEFNALKKTVEENESGRVKSLQDEVFNDLAKGDADLKAKLEAEYKSFRGEPKTKEEILSQAQKAFSIVKPVVVPNAFDAFNAARGGSSSGAGTGNGGKKYEPTPDVASVGSKLGISKEDFEKYGSNI